MRTEKVKEVKKMYPSWATSNIIRVNKDIYKFLCEEMNTGETISEVLARLLKRRMRKVT